MFEDVERDVGEAGVNVGVDGQDRSVSTDHATRENVSLRHRKDSIYICTDGSSTDVNVCKSSFDNR